MSVLVMRKPQTAFSILEHQFPNASSKLITKEFLHAASGLVSLLERFGKMFSPIIYDMNGNINKLTKKYEEDEESHKYLEDMILKEDAAGGMTGIDALLWLKRGMHFFIIFYQLIIDDTLSERCSNDLTPFLKRAYQDTLERYHGWVGTQLFNVLSRFTPNRRQLIYTLALEQHDQDDNVIRDMQMYVTRVRNCLSNLNEFYDKFGLEP